MDDASIFSVSTAMHIGSWLVCENPGIWKRLADFESLLLSDEMDAVTIESPIWVTGLARSGSTLLLEILAGIPGVASHSYKDFPPVFTPFAWHRLLNLMQRGPGTLIERAHQDGMLVTADSPEAMEEPLWMAFFSGLHDSTVSNVIVPGQSPEFAVFLRNHIRKLLCARDASRYLSKANYQLTRMEYLLDIFPDARFVIPVRDPVMHIASLMKTHELFSRGQRANQRARRHLQRVGHFEFGLDRQAINCGDDAVCEQIAHLWRHGDDARAWAIYWNHLYSYVLRRIQQNPQLSEAVLLVSFDRFCEHADSQLLRVVRHCNLTPEPRYVARVAERIKAPSYYRAQFDAAQLQEIKATTQDTLEQLLCLADASKSTT